MSDVARYGFVHEEVVHLKRYPGRWEGVRAWGPDAHAAARSIGHRHTLWADLCPTACSFLPVLSEAAAAAAVAVHTASCNLRMLTKHTARQSLLHLQPTIPSTPLPLCMLKVGIDLRARVDKISSSMAPTR